MGEKQLAVTFTPYTVFWTVRALNEREDGMRKDIGNAGAETA